MVGNEIIKALKSLTDKKITSFTQIKNNVCVVTIINDLSTVKLIKIYTTGKKSHVFPAEICFPYLPAKF